MRGCAAPKQSPTVFSPVRHIVTRTSRVKSNEVKMRVYNNVIIKSLHLFNNTIPYLWPEHAVQLVLLLSLHREWLPVQTAATSEVVVGWVCWSRVKYGSFNYSLTAHPFGY